MVNKKNYLKKNKKKTINKKIKKIIKENSNFILQY